MAIYKPNMLDKFKDFITGMRGNADELESTQDDLVSHKADYASLIAGGERFTATLKNGWTHPDYAVRYRKNDLGVVHLSGRLDAGTITANTTILTLPVGYRPIAYMVVPAYDMETGKGDIESLRFDNNGSLAVGNYANLVANSRLVIDLTFRTR